MKTEELIDELKKYPNKEIRLAFYEENGNGNLRDSDSVNKVNFNCDNKKLYISN